MCRLSLVGIDPYGHLKSAMSDCKKKKALLLTYLSYYGDRGSKTVKAYYRRVLYRAWGLTAHRGWARLMLDRRRLVLSDG